MKHTEKIENENECDVGHNAGGYFVDNYFHIYNFFYQNIKLIFWLSVSQNWTTFSRRTIQC